MLLVGSWFVPGWFWLVGWLVAGVLLMAAWFAGGWLVGWLVAGLVVCWLLVGLFAGCLLVC